jgi:hypothetical protein
MARKSVIQQNAEDFIKRLSGQQPNDMQRRAEAVLSKPVPKSARPKRDELSLIDPKAKTRRKPNVQRGMIDRGRKG